MIIANFRQGLGFDIEYNEDICHIVDTGEEEYTLFGFTGVIIMLPFMKIYIGEMDELYDLPKGTDD
jgi:hypothetical protein